MLREEKKTAKHNKTHENKRKCFEAPLIVYGSVAIESEAEVFMRILKSFILRGPERCHRGNSYRPYPKRWSKKQRHFFTTSYTSYLPTLSHGMVYFLPEEKQIRRSFKRTATSRSVLFPRTFCR